MIKEIIFENDEVSIKKNVDKNGFEININETKCSSEDIKKWKELILQNHFNYSTRQNIYYKKIDNDAKSFIKEFASNISKKKDDFVISREELETAKLVIPKEQYKATLQLLQGEEKEHYIKIIKNLSEKVNSHSLFSSDDNNEHPLILHYFIGNTDIYISEIDKITKEGFGYTILNGDLQNSEWGYQQIDEITSISGIELDYYVTEEQTIEQKVNQDYPNNFQNKNTAQNTISNLSPEDKEYIPYNQIKNIDFVELSKSKEEIDSSRKATDFVMAKLENAGIEVIQDKETFDEILTREIVLQKAHQNITSEEVHSYFKFENKEIEKYNNTLDNWEQNKNNPRKLIVIGSIPPVMKAIGIADIPIEIENSVISKVLRDEPIYPDEKQGHKLNLEDIREIPTLLADPIMIFKSNTRSDSFVFFTERKDTKNRSIIIPLAVQKKIGRISINQVTSMYGRNNEIEFVYDNVKNKKLIYVDTRRALEWEKLVLTNDFDKKINLDGGLESQVQFLRQRLTKQQGFTDNILTKERLVNFISSRQLMTQNGTVYGFAHEGKIYLNPDIADSNVAVHEYTHLWDKYNQNTNPELWQKGKDVFQKTTLWNEVKEDPNYADIADNDDLVLSECHARICGDIAQKVLEKIAERDGEIAKDAVIDWDKEVWNYIGNELLQEMGKNISNDVDLKEFLATPMKDLMNERHINIKNNLDKKIETESNNEKINLKSPLEEAFERTNRELVYPSWLEIPPEEREYYLTPEEIKELDEFISSKNSQDNLSQSNVEIKQAQMNISLSNESQEQLTMSWDSKTVATNYVLDKLKESGLEVIQDKEIFENILNSDNFLQKSHVLSQNEKLNAYFEFKKEEMEAFEKLIDNYENTKNNPRKLNLIGNIPPVMKAIGISEQPIEIENSVIEKALRPEPIYPADKQGHNLSRDDIREIPNLLANPIMVFKSNTRKDSYIFFTERKDFENRSIIIPLAADKRKGRLVINEITSIYGRKNEYNFVNDNIDNQNLIYFDKKRCIEWEQKNRRENVATQKQYLGERFSKLNGYINNILTKENLVNFLSSKQLMIENGTTYGFAHAGKIYLNPETLNSNVAVHEYTHLWDKYTQNTNPELWQKGLDIFKDTKLWNDVKTDPNYADIAGDDDLVLSEVHSRITGKLAAQVLERIAKEDGEIAKDKIIDWDKEVWNYIAKEFEVDLFTNKDDLQMFLALPIKDLMSGKNIFLENVLDRKNEEVVQDEVFLQNEELQKEIEESSKENAKAYVLNKINNSGIEVILDKEKFDEILTSQEKLQKMVDDLSALDKLAHKLEEEQKETQKINEKKLSLEEEQKVIARKNWISFIEVANLCGKYLQKESVYSHYADFDAIKDKLLVLKYKDNRYDTFLVKNDDGNLSLINHSHNLQEVNYLFEIGSVNSNRIFETFYATHKYIFNAITPNADLLKQSTKEYLQQKVVDEQQKKVKLIQNISVLEKSFVTNEVLHSFQSISNVLKTGDEDIVHNKFLGDVELRFGGKNEGLAHIVLRRIEERTHRTENREDFKIAQRNVAMILHLTREAVINGAVVKSPKGNWNSELNGIKAIIAKDKNGKYILTGFDNKQKKEESTEAINAGIAKYSNTPEFLDMYAQVGAVYSSYNGNISFLEELSSNKQLMTQNGTVYGFAHEGMIYLNPDIADSNVAVHEYTHLWDKYTQNTNPELWQEGKNVFKGTSLWQKVINDPNYSDIAGNEDLVLSECHARICGDIAQKVLEEIAKEDGEIAKDKIIDWDKEVWNYIAKEFEVDLFTNKDDLQMFLALPIKDLMSGKNILTEKEFVNNSLQNNHSQTSISSQNVIEISGNEIQEATTSKTIKQIKEIRKQCFEILEKDISQITAEERKILSQYEGAGGLNEKDSSVNGILNEFYTPESIVNKVWEIVDNYSPNAKTVLEPTSGIGRFANNRQNNTFTMYETDNISSKINKILHPDSIVINEPYQKQFFDDGDRFLRKDYVQPEYDVVIGNPPYGIYNDKYKGLGEGKEFNRYEEYFISKGLDALKKDNGNDKSILAMVVPSGFMNTGLDKQKQIIATKGILLDAWRLPEKAFSTTDVGTDIILMRKYKDIEKNNSLTIKESAEIISNGKFFEYNPDRILGEEQTRINRFGKSEKYIKIHENMTIEDELSKITESIAKQKQKQDEFQKNQVENLTEIESDKIEINEPLPTTDIKTEKKKVMSMEEFSRMYHRDFDKEEYPIYKATNWEGIIEYIKLGEESKNYLKTSKKYVEINENEWQHKTLFCSGDIYKKIEEQKQIIATMQNDDLKKKIEKNIQLLEDSKNKKIPIDNIHIGALTTLAEEFKIVKKHENDDEEELNLQEGFILWATGKPIDEYSRYSIDFVTANISKEDFPTNVSWWDVVNYIDKVAIIAQRTSESSYRSQEENEELRKQRAIEAEQKRITRADTANKLFDKYIHEGLNKEDTERFENEYNRRFNSFVAPDYLKLPLYVDGMSPTKGDSPFRLYQQQLKGAAFTSYKGNGIIAYDVGVGKTATGIVSTIIQLQSKRCKRPILLVPNKVYEKWYSDIKELFPNIKINDLFNLNKKAVASYKDENDAHRLKIPNNSLTLCTYEALNNITFRNETCENELFFDFEKLIGSSENKKDRANIIKSISSVIGTASSVKDSNYYFFENCGFDNIIVDEAHNFRNLWTTPRSDNSREANEYKGIPTGKPSKRALKLYAATQYIQKKSNNRNVFMLTATPFDNSPLEVYSMLSYVGRQRLIDSGIYSLRDFINQFAETKLELSVSEDNEVKYKQVMKSWKELPALQNLLSEFIDKVDGEEAGIFRPNKNTKKIELDCSPLQQKIINTEIKRMDIKTDKDTGKSTGNTLKAMNNMRIALVSPALLHKSDYIGTDIVLPDVKDMVESSPKLKFVCDTIIELYKDNPEKGQYMYMPLGKSAHPFVKEYLVSKGIPTEAIEIINGEINSDVKKQIIIQNNFNNKDHKLKILIGGENTKEGIDLNGNTFVMYNMSLGWNPSDRTQSEGRIWRQGNEQGVVNCVYPVMYDCIDSKLLQKHDEKGSRINALWTYKGNSVEAEDSINPEELKFELIKDPSKKAELILAEETKDITAEISNIKLKLSTIDEIVERTKSINQQLALYIRNESRLQSNIDEIKKTEKEIPNYLKMELKEAKRLLTNVKLQKENIDAKLNHLNIHTEDEISQYISNLNMKKHSLEEDKEEMRKRLPEMIEEFKIQVAEKKILSHPSEEQRLELVKQINSEIIPFKKILPKLKKNRLEKYVAEKLKTGEMDENLSKIVLRNGYDNWTKWREGELTDNEYMNLNKVNQNINSNENKKEEKLEKSLKQEFIRNVADKDIQQFELFSLEDIQECKTDAEKIKFIDDTSITERQLEEIKQKQLEIINPVINGEKTGLWNVFNTFKETGLLDIKGSQIELKNNNITSNGWKQLHAVMDIYRDKMFETFRYVMINRETGKITDQLSINSQMPGITLAELNDDTLKQVITRAEQTDSLIACVHNHPSGNIQPSKFDISTTETLFKRLNSSSGNVERFVGHIILDHNSFSIINKDNTCNYITDKITNVDKFVKENNPSWTKHEIKSFGDLVNVAKSINDINNWNDNYIPLVFVNGKQIHGVQLFDPKFFDNSSDEIKKELQTSCLTVGSTMAFPIITNKYLEKNTPEEQEKLESNIVNHIKNNAFTDCSIGNVSVCEKYNLIPEMIVKDVSIEELKNRTKLHSTWNLTVNPNLFRQELKKNENAVMGR